MTILKTAAKETTRLLAMFEISCGHTTDFYHGKIYLPRENFPEFTRGKFILGFTEEKIGKLAQMAILSGSFWNKFNKRFD